MDYQARIQAVNQQYAEQIADAGPRQRQTLKQEQQQQIDRLHREKQVEHAEKSYLGRIGQVMSPVFEPIGIEWRGSVAILTGFVAKEIVVSTLGVLYAVKGETDSEALRRALQSSGMTPLSALSLMVFVLLYIPCLATVAAIARETGSVRWAFLSVAYTTAVAWMASFVVYQGGGLLMG